MAPRNPIPPRVADIAMRGLRHPTTLGSKEIHELCEYLAMRYSDIERGPGTFLIFADGHFAGEQAGESRRDALMRWLDANKYESLVAAAAGYDCNPDQITVTELPEGN